MKEFKETLWYEEETIRKILIGKMFGTMKIIKLIGSGQNL